VLPDNARAGDFVVVNNKENTYYGMIGRIKEITPIGVTVDIYGKLVKLNKGDLILRARVGMGKHDELVEQVNSQECAHLDEIGYDGLIDLAIDLKEWGWAKELVDRKYEYLAKKNKTV
jgi:signal peptidase I